MDAAADRGTVAGVRFRFLTAPILGAALASLLAGIGALGLAAAPGHRAEGGPRAAAAPGQSMAWTSLFPVRIDGLRRCDTFEAAVEVWDAVDLAAFQLQIGFDPTVLEFAAASVAPWLAARWPAYSELPPVETPGNVLFAAAADDGSGSASGNGEMAHVTFRAVGAGTTDLDLHDVQLIDTTGAVVAVTSTGSIVVVLDQAGSGCVVTPTITPSGTPPAVTPSRTHTSLASATPTPSPSGTASREPTPGTPLPTTPSTTPTGTDLPTLTPSATASLGSGTLVPSPETPASPPPTAVNAFWVYLPVCRAP